MEFDDEVCFLFYFFDGWEEFSEVDHFSGFCAAAAEEEANCVLFLEIKCLCVELFGGGDRLHVVKVGFVAVFTL